MVSRCVIVLAPTLLLTVISCAGTSQKVHLQFRSAPGERHVVRVSDERMTNTEVAGAQEYNKAVWTQVYTVALDLAQTDTDGMARVRVTIQAIQIKIQERGSSTFLDYDSQRPRGAPKPFEEHLSAFVGRSFTIKVSPQGELKDAGLDELFRAVAGIMIERFDQALKEKYGSDAQGMIEKADARYGSREKRKLGVMKELELRPLPRSEIEYVLRNLLSPFPATPVRCGDTWGGSVLLYSEAHGAMDTVHTLKTVQQGICTIDVHGQGNLGNKPLILGEGSARIDTRLAGSYQATLSIEQKTGRLLSKQAKTSLAGEVQISERNPQPQTVPFIMEVTTTVETIE